QLSSSAPSTNPGESTGSTRSRRARPVSAGTLKRSPVITISASSPRRRRVACSRNTTRVRASTCSSLETLVISVSSAVSKRSLAAVIVVPPLLDSPARRIPRCGRDIYTRPLDSRPLIHESPAFVLRRDPTTHVLRAVDDLGSRHFDPREKAHRRPIDEGDDILQIEYDATGRRGREQLLQGTSVLRGWCALNCGFRNHSRPLTLLMSKPSRTAATTPGNSWPGTAARRLSPSLDGLSTPAVTPGSQTPCAGRATVGIERRTTRHCEGRA